MRSLQWKGYRTWLLQSALASAAVLFPYLQSMHASGIAFQTGDVLAGVGNGQIKHFNADGTLLDTLDTGAGNTEDTGMAFDVVGNLYATVFQANNLYKFDNKGNRVGPFGSGYNQDPESIVFDKNGNAYVGQADGPGQILKFDPSGALIAMYSPQREDRGTDWVDLAADQCTLHYTSEGPSIKRLNVCTNTQMSDFATGLSAPCFAHRIRPNFEELVACASQVYRLNSSGSIIQTYQPPGTSFLFALNLDPDNKTFWTGDYFSGAVFRIDIATGTIVKQFNAGITQTLAGLAVAGEITAAITPPPPFTTSYYVTSSKSSTLHNLGVTLAQSQTAQESVVALLFRAPTFKNGQYGIAGLGGSAPLSSVAALVEAFASGYYNSLGTNQSLHVRIIIATSNGTTSLGGNQVAFAHGQAWAQMVDTVASWVVGHGYAGQVDIAGGSDMELSTVKWQNGSLQWASAADTRAWVDGYASVFPQRFLYDVGDAGGCPGSGATGIAGACNAGWTQDDLRYVSWGAPPSEPLPEIYYNANAKQWANLSLYGYLKYHESIIIAGALTEFQACQTRLSDPTCNPPNSPEQGWQQLYTNLHSNVNTDQTLPWSTDINWMSH